MGRGQIFECFVCQEQFSNFDDDGNVAMIGGIDGLLPPRVGEMDPRQLQAVFCVKHWQMMLGLAARLQKAERGEDVEPTIVTP